jgi:phage terminase large subunit
VKGIGCEVIQVKVSESAFDQERFYRLRDELWWRMREAFERGVISIPDDPILKGDLNAPKYDDSTGVIKIESKDQLKKRGVDSPNRADALMMTFLQDEAMVRRLHSHRTTKNTSRAASWRTV